MNKIDLISQVSERTGVSKNQVKAVIAATTAQIQSALSSGDSVRINNFGTFEVRAIKPRTGRNPCNGAVMLLEAYNKPAFRAGFELKAAVNKL